MNTETILNAIDAQIAQLQKARELLGGITTPTAVATHHGRPKGSKNKTAAAPVALPAKATKRVMSAEGKARIAAAQKRRWEKQKKAATPAKAAVKNPESATGKKAAAKKASAKKTAAVEASS